MKRLTKWLASAALIIPMCLTGLTAHAANHVSAQDAEKTTD